MKPVARDVDTSSQKKVAAGMKKITEILKQIMEENDAMQKATQIKLDLISEEMNAIDYHSQKRILNDSALNMAQLMHHPLRWGSSLMSSTKTSFKCDDNGSSASTSPYNQHYDKVDVNGNGNNIGNGNGNNIGHNHSNYNMSASDNYLFYRRNFSYSTNLNPSHLNSLKEKEWRTPTSLLSEKTESGAKTDEIKEMRDLDIREEDEEEEDEEDVIQGDVDSYVGGVAAALRKFNGDVIPSASTSGKH